MACRQLSFSKDKAMPIEFSDVRYIKLGPGGAWNDVCLDNNEIHFKFGDISHELALADDRQAIRQRFIELGRASGTATSFAREITEFYALGSDCLWITFAREHLWWTFARPNVEWIGGDGRERGFRKRLCHKNWSNTDVEGKPLRIDGLSGALTRVKGFRGTICKVGDAPYLSRRINGLEDPITAAARIAREAFAEALESAVKTLNPDNLELLSDLLFARGGWVRISPIGGNQEFLDFAIEQPATAEIAAVQVKAQSCQAELDDYIAKYDAAGFYARLFFICHTSPTTLLSERDDVHVWQSSELTRIVQRLGLSDWVLQKIS